MTHRLASRRSSPRGGHGKRALGLIGGAALVSLVAMSPRTAHAQLTGSGTGIGSSGSSYGISLASTVVQRYYPNSDTKLYPFRNANLNPNDINYQDCEDDIHLVFNLIESGGSTTSSPDILEIWAGTTDCTQTTARSGAESPFCWQVAGGQQFVLNAQVDIYARVLTRYVDSTLNAVPNGGATISPSQPESACHTQTSTGQVALNIYFMFLPNTGDAVPDASLAYPLNIDLVGPLAPYNLTAGIGEKLLLLNWNDQIDPTIAGFNVYAEDQGANGLGLGTEAGAAMLNTPIYCHQGGGTTTCADAGLSGEGGSSVDACTTSYSDSSAYSEVPDAAGYANLSDAALEEMGCTRGSPVMGVSTGQIGGGSCTSSVLVDKFTANVSLTTTTDDAGNTVADGSVITPIVTTVEGGAATGLVGISTVADAYAVGNLGGNTSTSFNVQTLSNGQSLIDGHQYAVAVAAYDDDGNVGLLSNLYCQTPEPIIDFWDRYAGDGGTAGGGYCALQAAGVPVAGSVFGVGVGVAIVAFARRRRRRNS
jgi:hypothetical protein